MKNPPLLRRNVRQARFRVELKRLLKRGLPAAKAMKQAWRRVPKNPRRLTRTKARAILHHGRARGRALTSAQRGLFGAIASGSRLRDYDNPPPTKRLPDGRMLVWRWRGPKYRSNPPSVGRSGEVQIYADIERIYGRKGQQSAAAGEHFVHNFRHAAAYGKPDGTVVLRGRGGRRLWDYFKA